MISHASLPRQHAQYMRFQAQDGAAVQNIQKRQVSIASYFVTPHQILTVNGSLKQVKVVDSSATCSRAMLGAA